MPRDLNLPGTSQPFGVGYMQNDNKLGSNEEYNLNQPTTLKHSWYKAVSHQFNNAEVIKKKLHSLRLEEIELTIKYKVDLANKLKEHLVPLQAKLDIVLDSYDSYHYTHMTPKEHICEGPKFKVVHGVQPSFESATSSAISNLKRGKWC
jgi:hypothetical protein